jgi:hypothetical protein
MAPNPARKARREVFWIITFPQLYTFGGGAAVEEGTASPSAPMRAEYRSNVHDTPPNRADPVSPARFMPPVA